MSFQRVRAKHGREGREDERSRRVGRGGRCKGLCVCEGVCVYRRLCGCRGEDWSWKRGKRGWVGMLRGERRDMPSDSCKWEEQYGGPSVLRYADSVQISRQPLMMFYWSAAACAGACVSPFPLMPQSAGTKLKRAPLLLPRQDAGIDLSPETKVAQSIQIPKCLQFKTLWEATRH